ncbi:MAG: cation-translocating P-type ATPase, partial [Ignavibacteria bacterium]|nr:cation-translocating P-type ATPase [Ignavibacteria bacterium]
RLIRDNNSKTIAYLLSCNMGELFTLLAAALMNWPIPLLPIHILWINLVTDSLPALALGIDPAEQGIMKREPNRDKGLLNKSMVYRITYQGFLIGVLTIIAFLYGYGMFGMEGSIAQGQTMAFIVLAFSQLIHAYNIHSHKLSVIKSFLKNKWLILATFTNAIMMLAVLFIPILRDLFKLVELDLHHWEVVLILMFIPLIFVEIMKLLKLNGRR